MTVYTIERGHADQARALQMIERAAGSRFRGVGMAAIADAEPTPLAILEDRASQSRLLVAVDANATLAGFLMWSAKDGRAYIEEVSVHPDHAGHRLAARMIDALDNDVRSRLRHLSLTTFCDIPWNAPYYEILGFTELPFALAGPEHEVSWQQQAENGLDMSRRLFMSRPVKNQ
ncbi:MAG: GNAT family N-acetyltransferase [Alphaproteobacteria bacterium]|nr:GNAT family N-acetyltransferase [Alphaproteobacteria bacterium]